MKYLASDPIPPVVASGVPGAEPRAARPANGAGAAVPGAVRVRPFAEPDRAAWNAFVLAHPDGTFFHQAEWQDVLRQSFGHRTHFLLAERDERPALCAAIEEKTGAAEAGSVGKTALFYRQHPDAKKRTIELPAPKGKSAGE